MNTKLKRSSKKNFQMCLLLKYQLIKHHSIFQKPEQQANMPEKCYKACMVSKWKTFTFQSCHRASKIISQLINAPYWNNWINSFLEYRQIIQFCKLNMRTQCNTKYNYQKQKTHKNKTSKMQILLPVVFHDLKKPPPLCSANIPIT